MSENVKEKNYDTITPGLHYTRNYCKVHLYCTDTLIIFSISLMSSSLLQLLSGKWRWRSCRKSIRSSCCDSTYGGTRFQLNDFTQRLTHKQQDNGRVVFEETHFDILFHFHSVLCECGVTPDCHCIIGTSGSSSQVLIGGPGWGRLFLGHIQPREKRQILHSDTG